MDEFVNLGGATRAVGSFTYPTTAAAPSQPSSSNMFGTDNYVAAVSSLHQHEALKAEEVSIAGSSSQHQQQDMIRIRTETAAVRDFEAAKAKIIAHPQYSALLAAYLECQKVGAPPDVAARLSAVGQELEVRHRASTICRHYSASDPELDQFMEAYCNMLAKYREELARPIEEALDFLRQAESQFNSLTNGSARVFSYDDIGDGAGSSEDDQDESGGEADNQAEIDPRAEDRELKHHLLKKYSGYLSSLRQELSKKKKKGKLPKEARQKLLNWWELHYKWPYPSESEKVALAESTGLDQKQINNWFINQRKRHWKPTEDMQFVMMDGYHPYNTAAFYLDGPYMHDGAFRLGP